MAALRSAGHAVAAAKVGPDFVDPGYHALATGRPGRNLDAYLSGAENLAPLAARAAGGADVLIVEGVMGLFDGVGATHDASTAAVAVALDAPVVLVVDASAMSSSVGALVHGFHSHRPDVRLAGVILNRVGSTRHESLLRQALEPVGVPVLGALHRHDALTWRDRHLGLVPVIEHPAEVRSSLDRLAGAITASCDLAGIMRLAAAAPRIPPVAALATTRRVGRARVAVAGGAAFSFTYTDNIERLEAAGAELVPFDPAADPALPDAVDGLYLGGGFPEVYAPALAANRTLLTEVRQRVAGGLVTWAECGGLLWLCRSLDGQHLSGAIDAEAAMTGRLTLGYRTAEVRTTNPVAAEGDVIRGHEFHYSAIHPTGSALLLRGSGTARLGGFATPTLLASYLHLHLGADPVPAERFVASAARRPAAR